MIFIASSLGGIAPRENKYRCNGAQNSNKHRCSRAHMNDNRAASVPHLGCSFLRSAHLLSRAHIYKRRGRATGISRRRRGMAMSK